MGVVNGEAYDWSSITINMPGMTFQAQDISYDDELEKEPVYGMGSSQRGYGKGNYKSTAKITMLKEDFDDLVDYCKKNKVALYKLDITKIIASYAHDYQKTKIDVLNKVTITKTSHKATQGDKSLKVDLDLLVYGNIVRDGLDAI
jgi:hypothetical protein